MFGVDFVLPLLRSKGASTAHDIIATLTAFTAHSIARAITEFVLPRHQPREMLVSGGGVHNPVLMMHLKQLLPMMAVRPLDAGGLQLAVCSRQSEASGRSGASRRLPIAGCDR